MTPKPIVGARVLLRHRALLREVRGTTDWYVYRALLRATRDTPHGRTVASLLLWRAHAKALQALVKSQSARLQEAARRLAEFEAKDAEKERGPV